MLFSIWLIWIALIKREIFITTGIAWPVSSDKWKAPFGDTANGFNNLNRQKKIDKIFIDE